MKTLLSALMAFCVLLFGGVATHASWVATLAAQSEIEGDWLAEGKFKIRITRNGDIYQGKVIWLKPGEETKDIHNEDKSLRSRDIVGITMLDGFQRSSTNQNYTGGTMYMFPRGKTITTAQLSVAGNQLKLKIRMGILSKTLLLTRG